MENQIITNTSNIDINTLNDILDALNQDNGEYKAIEGLLNLSDQEFALVYESVLENLEKSLNDPSQIVMLSAAMNAQGLKSEDIAEMLPQLGNEIDEGLKSVYSQIKIDFLKRLIYTLFNGVLASENCCKRIVSIPIQLCHENAQIPVYAKLDDAGMDVIAIEDITINPGETKIIPTGLKCAIPKGYELQVRPRSGLSVKTPLRVANAPGTIDSGYRGEIGIIVSNIEPNIKNIEQEPVLDESGAIKYFTVSAIEYGQSYTITKGMKFAQLVLSEVPTASFFEVNNIDEIPSERGAGGFGSTGV